MVIHYEEALYQVYGPLPLTFTCHAQQALTAYRPQAEFFKELAA